MTSISSRAEIVIIYQLINDWKENWIIPKSEGRELETFRATMIARRTKERETNKKLEIGASWIVNARLLAAVNGERVGWRFESTEDTLFCSRTLHIHAKREKQAAASSSSSSSSSSSWSSSSFSRVWPARLFSFSSFWLPRGSRVFWLGSFLTLAVGRLIATSADSASFFQYIPTRIPDPLGQRKGRARLKPVKWN